MAIIFNMSKKKIDFFIFKNLLESKVLPLYYYAATFNKLLYMTNNNSDVENYKDLVYKLYKTFFVLY